MKVNIDKIQLITDANPRIFYGDLEALADDMLKNGQLESLKVAYYKDLDKYYILDGHRRLKAAKLNNWAVLEVTVVKTYEGMVHKNTLQKDLYKILLQTEHKRNLDIVEYAVMTKELLAQGMQNADIAAFTGKSKSLVTRWIHFSKLDERTWLAIREGEITGQRIRSLFTKNNYDLELTQSDIHKILNCENKEVETIDIEELEEVQTPSQFAAKLNVNRKTQSFVREIVEAFVYNKDIRAIEKTIYKFLPQKF